jgi:hypothetical protein
MVENISIYGLPESPMVIHLLSVFLESQQEGDMRKNIWLVGGHTRSTLLQNDIEFYTEDWKPYLDLKLFNHKDSPIIFLGAEAGNQVFPH